MSEKNNQPKSAPQAEKEKRQQRKPWHRKGQHGEIKKKDPEAIPVLKYGPGNNFAKFKEAISKVALKEYGDLGKLIRQGAYYIPPAPDKTKYGSFDPAIDVDGMNKVTYLEDMKAYRKKMREMEDDRSKLFALIIMYLSEESLDAVKRESGWDKIEDEADPEGLWMLVEKKHKVHSASEVKEVTKLTARANYQMIRQGGYESIIAYKERFSFALKAYEDQGNKKLDDLDIAMDFFRGLDNARYATFKMDYINGLTSKAIDPPKDLNEIYLLANQWLKPKVTTSSFASTFSMTLDRVDEGERRDKRRGKRQPGGKKMPETNNKDKDGNTNIPKKDMR